MHSFKCVSADVLNGSGCHSASKTERSEKHEEPNSLVKCRAAHWGSETHAGQGHAARRTADSSLSEFGVPEKADSCVTSESVLTAGSSRQARPRHRVRQRGHTEACARSQRTQRGHTEAYARSQRTQSGGREAQSVPAGCFVFQLGRLLLPRSRRLGGGQGTEPSRNQHAAGALPSRGTTDWGGGGRRS